MKSKHKSGGLPKVDLCLIQTEAAISNVDERNATQGLSYVKQMPVPNTSILYLDSTLNRITIKEWPSASKSERNDSDVVIADKR